MADATFTLDDLPGITFEATRGSGGSPDQPSNWLRIVATKPGEPTEDDPNPDPVTLCDVGFAGP